MPGDSLSLAVRVSRQVNLLGLLHFLAKLGQHISLSADGNILRLIVVFYVNAQLALRQISHMSVGGVHLVIGAQKFFYRLHFCR